MEPKRRRRSRSPGHEAVNFPRLFLPRAPNSIPIKVEQPPHASCSTSSFLLSTQAPGSRLGGFSAEIAACGSDAVAGMDCRGFPHHPRSTSPGHRVQLPSLNSHKNQFLGVLPCSPHFTVDVARASRIHRVCEGQCSPCPTQVTDVTKPAQNLRPSRPNPSPGATPHARLTLKRIWLLLRALLLSQLLAPLLDFLIPVDDVLLGETKMRGSPPSPSRSWQKTSSQRATMGKTLGMALDQASVFPTPSLGSSGGARKIQVRARAKPVPPSPSCSSWETPKSLEMPPKCSHWSPRKENPPAALSSASAQCVIGEDHFWNTDLTTNSAWTPHIQTGHPKFSLDIHQGHREVLSYHQANSPAETRRFYPGVWSRCIAKSLCGTCSGDASGSPPPRSS